MPLELHHTVMQGSRTFKCSLVYITAGANSSSSNDGSDSNGSSTAAAHQQQPVTVTVTVQELGRRWVPLALC